MAARQIETAVDVATHTGMASIAAPGAAPASHHATILHSKALERSAAKAARRRRLALKVALEQTHAALIRRALDEETAGDALWSSSSQ